MRRTFLSERSIGKSVPSLSCQNGLHINSVTASVQIFYLSQLLIPSSTMPSFSRAVALAAIIPFTLAGTPETCTDTQLSCQASSSNTCCFNTPGGLFQQVQFWDTDPSTGPTTSWTIHGLWPNNCDGTYSEDCDESRAYTDITELLENAGNTSTLDFMQTYWVSDDESNEAFWDHEWETHGTCVSTLNPDCYTDYTTGEEAVDFFNTVVTLFQTLPTYDVSLRQFHSQSIGTEISFSGLRTPESRRLHHRHTSSRT